MDVRLPDGTVVRNVPEGTTRAQLMARIQKRPDRSGVLGTLDAAVRGFNDMTSLGLADKVVAGINTVLPLDKITNPNIKSVYETGDFGKAFRNNLSQEEKIAAADEQEHAPARAIGQIAGGVMGPVPGRGLIGAGAARLGRAAELARIAGEGAAQGGAYGLLSGSSTDIGGRLRNAGNQAVSGAAGSLIGAGAVRGAARAVAPVVNPVVRRLAQAGVTMTPGQRGGPVARFVEQAAESIPLIREPIKAAKGRGIEQFNRALVNEGLSPLGVRLPKSIPAGRKAMEFAQEAIGDNYDQALQGLNISPDDLFVNGLGQTVGKADNLPPAQAQTFKYIMQSEVQPLIENGGLSGENLQRVNRLLQKRAAGAMKAQDGMGDLLADNLQEVRRHFLDLAERQAPDRIDLFQRANDAEANMNRVYDAVSRSVGDGLTTPKRFSQAVARRGYGTTTKRVAAGNARMQDLADAASQVLPDTLPNSGTADRVALLSGIGALGTGGAGVALNPALLAPAAATAAYVPGVDRALQALALRGQNETAQSLADSIRKRAYIGGMFGAPAGIVAGQ